ncbi:unnamed protein product, partial [Ectocarpus fasciculatus]
YLWAPVAIIVLPFVLIASANSTTRAIGVASIVLYLATFDGSHKTAPASKPWPFFINLPIVRYVLEWLPIKIRRTTELDKDQLYVFACHPHGTLAFNRGAVGFSTDTLWDAAFPGIKFRVLTATAAFFVPFIRELWLWSYCVDASKPTAVRAMQVEKSSVFVYPGGEKEQLETVYGEQRVFLKSRKGFVKLAIEQGAHLVPVYAFGETNLYSHSQFLIGFRKWLVNKFGVAVPLLWGQYGLMPYKTAVTLVFGKPIVVTKKANPSQAEVSEMHKEYITALTQLFEQHKESLGYGNKELMIL